MWVAVIFYFARSLDKVQLRNENLTRQLEADLHGAPEPETTLEQVAEESKKLGATIRRTWKYVYLAAGLGIIFYTSHLVSIAEVTYIDSALSHYHQVMRIASPYLDANEQLVVQSEFAQIRNRQGYVDVIERLATLAKAHGQSVPKFNPW